MDRVLKNPVLRIPLGMTLLFLICVASESTYHSPVNLSLGLTVGSVFSLYYLAYEMFILSLGYCHKIWCRIAR